MMLTWSHAVLGCACTAAHAADLAELVAHVASADDLARLAHKMAGSAAIVGYTEIHRDLTDLETGFRTISSDSDRKSVQKAASMLRVTPAWRKLHSSI